MKGSQEISVQTTATVEMTTETGAALDVEGVGELSSKFGVTEGQTVTQAKTQTISYSIPPDNTLQVWKAPAWTEKYGTWSIWGADGYQGEGQWRVSVPDDYPAFDFTYVPND